MSSTANKYEDQKNHFLYITVKHDGLCATRAWSYYFFHLDCKIFENHVVIYDMIKK